MEVSRAASTGTPADSPAVPGLSLSLPPAGSAAGAEFMPALEQQLRRANFWKAVELAAEADLKIHLLPGIEKLRRAAEAGVALAERCHEAESKNLEFRCLAALFDCDLRTPWLFCGNYSLVAPDRGGAVEIARELSAFISGKLLTLTPGPAGSIQRTEGIIPKLRARLSLAAVVAPGHCAKLGALTGNSCSLTAIYTPARSWEAAVLHNLSLCIKLPALPIQAAQLEALASAYEDKLYHEAVHISQASLILRTLRTDPEPEIPAFPDFSRHKFETLRDELAYALDPFETGAYVKQLLWRSRQSGRPFGMELECFLERQLALIDLEQDEKNPGAAHWSTSAVKREVYRTVVRNTYRQAQEEIALESYGPRVRCS